ncbi:MAG: cytidylate kinase-like family protein [Deltaproteobacteria bacterium]|nr:cytidylate kinase-like family protein [Deltaproteobacteria bacterium]
MAVITITRQFGAGGWTLGNAVANRLGYKFVSRGIINKMAKEANVSVKWVSSVEKEAGDWLMRFMSKLVSSNFIERHIGEARSDFDENKYVSFLKRLIPAIAAQDNVVILGRGSHYILPDDPKTIKILLVADLEDRIAFTEKLWDVNRSEAEKAVLTRQKRSDAFLKKLDPRDPDDPGLYRVTINISKVRLEQAEEIIVGMVKSVESRL